MTPIAHLIYPHQLYVDHPALRTDAPIYLIEDPLFFAQYDFHRQKLMLHRASMRRWQYWAIEKGHQVHYVESGAIQRTEDIAKILSDAGVRSVEVVDPNDDWLTKRLTAGCQRQRIEIRLVPDSHFLCSNATFKEFAGGRCKLFFTEFYIEQRKRLGILLDERGKPIGSKWSFDTENRKKLPPGTKIPTVESPVEDSFAQEARRYTQLHFPRALGADRPLLYPSDPLTALSWLRRFIEERLEQFGKYEDAIAGDEVHLFHSVLTPMLNIGILSPHEIVNEVLLYWEANQGDRTDPLLLHSVEGFVRQVIGWREFVRGIYVEHGRGQRTSNSWNHRRPMPESFYDGTTGIEPVDTVIRRALSEGYTHHIERLMILGNFMFLCEIDPKAVYRWFMELFVDSYDWVMVPNIYGMSQNADGGLMTTKPYVSGSSYVLRMSNFRKGPWCEVWDGLYWRFIDKHRTQLAGNPRMSIMLGQLDRMGEKLQRHRQIAEQFLDRLVPNR